MKRTPDVAPSPEGREDRRLAALNAYRILDTGREPLFDDLARLAARACRAPMAIVSFIDRHRQWFKASHGLDLPETAREIAFCNHTIAAGRPLVVTDARADPRFAGNPLVTGEPKLRFYAGVPLVTDSGECIGSVAALDTRPREPAEHELKALEDLARLAIGILDARLERLGVETALEAEQGRADKLERKERQLQAAYAELDFHLDNTPLAIMEMDAGGRITRWSAQAAALFGFSEEEMLGRQVDDSGVLHPDDANKVAGVMEQLVSGKATRARLINRNLDRSGRVLVCEWYNSARLDEDGKLVSILSMASDITSRAAAEEALRTSRRRLRRVLENIPDVVVLYGPDLRIRYINAATERITGMKPAEFIGKRDEELFPAEEHRPVLDLLRRTLAGREKQELELDLDLPATGHRHLRITCIPLLGADGRVHEILGITHDQTEAVEQQRAIAAGKRLLEIAERTAKLGGWRADLEEGRVIWSDEVARIHGEPAGTSPSVDEDIDYYAPEYRERIREVFTRCAEAGEPYDEELQIINRAGERVWVRSIGEPVRDKNGRITAVQGAFQDISEVKAAEEALRRSEERHRYAAQASQAAIWEYDMASDRIQYTEAFRDMLGYDRIEDMPARRAEYMELMHPEDRERIGRLTEKLLAGETGDQASAEFRLKTRSGEYRWFQTNNMVIRDETGKPVRRLGSTIDVHERKVAEEHIRRLNRHLTATLESLSDAFFIVDKDWRLSYLNRHTGEMMGRDSEELVGKVLWEVFPEALGGTNHRHFVLAFNENRPVEYEYFDDERKRWLEVRAWPFDEGLAVYARDVTERKRADEALAESERRYRLLFESNPQPMFVFDQETLRFLAVNDAAVDTYGFSREEFLAMTILDIRPEEDIPRLERLLANPPEGFQDAGLWRHRRADGSLIEVEVSSHALTFDGRPAELVLAMDVTERRALEEQLRRSQRLEAVGQLTGGVAHDFNNLLTVILGNSEILVEKMADWPALQRLAEMSRSAAERGAELTRRLLAFARRQPLDPRPTDVAALIGDMRPLLSRSLTEKIELELIHDEDLWQAEVDPGQLESALLNLALNGRDAMPGGGRLTIETSNAELDADYAENHTEVEPGQYVQIAVSDTGLGIESSHIDRIFEPFFTTKDKGKGTGLGLAMVYGFVKQSAGHIKVYSEPGEGTTIRMYLPRAHSVDGSAPPRPAEAASLEGIGRVLVVEDNELVREHAERLLKSLNVSAVSAVDGHEALQILRADPAIDLLFTDVIMPGEFDGPALARAAAGLRPGLKVLFTSGYTENAIMHHGRLDPGVHLLQKPYRREDLARKLREVAGADRND